MKIERKKARTSTWSDPDADGWEKDVFIDVESGKIIRTD